MSAGTFHEYVASVLGAAPDHIEPGRLHRFSTNGKRGDTSGWAKLFEDCQAGVCGDWRQGIDRSVWTAVDSKSLTPAERAAFAKQVALAARERELQQQAKYRSNLQVINRLACDLIAVTDGDPVAHYLQRRGLRAACMSCLRYHPALAYIREGESQGVFPAMLAALRAPSGQIVSWHRTYLAPDGRKADVPTVKKLTPAAGPLRGAAVRLQPVNGGGVLGVSEGIETALAASLISGLPVWSTYCAHGLASFVWPGGIRKLVVFGDADTAGRTASDELRARAEKAGLAVSVLIPAVEGMDWADVNASVEVCQ